MAQRKMVDLVFPLNERDGFIPGDNDAHRAALAMGDRFDAPTIIAITDALTFLLKMGGQVQMATLRQWVDPEGRPVPQAEPGEWLTLGMTAHYETRDAKMQLQKPLREVMGTPIKDAAEPATPVDDYTAMDTEPESEPEEPTQERDAVDEPVLAE